MRYPDDGFDEDDDEYLDDGQEIADEPDWQDADDDDWWVAQAEIDAPVPDDPPRAEQLRLIHQRAGWLAQARRRSREAISRWEITW